MRITGVELACPDPERLRSFYGRVLGLSVAGDGDALDVRVGWTSLRFHVEAVEPGTAHHVAFNISPNLLDEAVVWLGDRVDLMVTGGEVVHDFGSWNAHSVYFRDPAGNILEFIARHRLAPDDASAFTPAAIRCVSEVGVPVPDVRAAIPPLRERFGCPLFDGGSATFAALGDDDGLIILVPVGREWYPATGVRSGPDSVAVGIDGSPTVNLSVR